MATIFRFVATDETTVNLDLNAASGWKLGLGLDLGEAGVEQEWLTQQPYDGATLAATRRDLAVMTVPLMLTQQVTWAAVKALMDALAVELTKVANIIEFRPDGAGSSSFIDTYQSPIPSFYRGLELQPIETRLRDVPMFLHITRAPLLRGAGTFI